MANMLAERIKNVPLTKKQKIIADYFIQNQDRIGSLSSLDAAREIGVSDASIIRFSRTIGFDGFADLKAHIYDMLVENANNAMSLTDRLAANAEKYGGQDMTLQFTQLMQQNIASVFHDNRMEDFDAVVERILGAEKRYVIGLRGCKGMAAQFGRLLAFMLPGVCTLTDGECTSLSHIQNIGEKDVVLMFVFTRIYIMDVEYLKTARKKGAHVILVTNDAAGPLKEYADEILMVSTLNMSFFHSTIAVDMMSEYLLNRISEKTDYRERIRERDEITAAQRWNGAK